MYVISNIEDGCFWNADEKCWVDDVTKATKHEKFSIQIPILGYWKNFSEIHFRYTSGTHSISHED